MSDVEQADSSPCAQHVKGSVNLFLEENVVCDIDGDRVVLDVKEEPLSLPLYESGPNVNYGDNETGSEPVSTGYIARKNKNKTLSISRLTDGKASESGSEAISIDENDEVNTTFSEAKKNDIDKQTRKFVLGKKYDVVRFFEKSPDKKSSKDKKDDKYEL